MFIKIRGELILVDYIYRIGKVKIVFNKSFNQYNAEVAIYFLNQKEITFSSTTYLYQSHPEYLEFQKERDLIWKKFEKGSPAYRGYIEKEENEAAERILKPLSLLIEKELNEIADFVKDAVDEFHKTQPYQIKELNYTR